MDKTLDFWFDFSSPYSYIANEWIDALAARHGRMVRRHAILLGVTFAAAELKSPVSYPIKREYSIRDFARSARYEGLPYFAGGARSGSTDANGMLREFIPVGARTVTLQVQQLTRDLDVGKLNPLLVTTTDQGASGAKGRLRNIGFAVVDVDQPSQLDLAEALRRFQSEQQLATSGQLDAATRARLQRVHGA